MQYKLLESHSSDVGGKEEKEEEEEEKEEEEGDGGKGKTNDYEKKKIAFSGRKDLIGKR